MPDALDVLKEHAWRGEMPDDLGRIWSGRYKAADEFHKDHTWDWEENRKLLVDFRNMVDKYGTYVAIGFAVLQNLVTDVYFRNPDTWVEDKRGNRDLGNILTGVFTAIHADCKTERKMKEALFDAGWSLGAVMISFEERQQDELVPILDDEGQPIVDEQGNVPTFQDEEVGEVPLAATDEDGNFLTQSVVQSQRIVEKRISPWRLRYDPDGLDWEFEDHKWVGIKFRRTLGQCIRDPRFTDEGKQKLIASFQKKNATNYQALQKISYSIVYSEERDPDFLDVELVEIWDRVNKKVIYMPVDEEFTIGVHAWPRWLAEADQGAGKFPVRLICFDREPEDEEGQHGFYPVPAVRRIKPHLYNLNRLSALFIEGNTHVVNKHVAPAGLFSPTEMTKLQSDKNREVITYDPKALAQILPANVQLSADAVRQLFFRVDQGDNKEMKHIEAIQNELNMIAQILGQSSGDRGGLAVSGSATEALGLQQRLQQRLSEQRAAAAKHYNALTELMFLALKSEQQLPIRYQMTTEYNQSVWQEFAGDQWQDLDLHFNFSTSPQEARTREQELALRQQVMQVVMPVAQELGDTRLIKWLIGLMAEPLDVPGVQKMLGDDASGVAAQLLQLDYAIRSGQIRPGDANVANMKQELTSKLIEVTISQADMNAIAQQMGGGAAAAVGGTGGGSGTPKSPVRSAGQKAAAMAAAGTVGGMNKG
jgi:hypothetical protein